LEKCKYILHFSKHGKCRIYCDLFETRKTTVYYLFVIVRLFHVQSSGFSRALTIYKFLLSRGLPRFNLVGFHVRSLYFCLVAWLGIMLAGCDNSSVYHEFAEAENRCIFRVPLSQDDENYDIKFDHIMALLLYKTFDAQDHDAKHLPEYEKKSRYVEFDMKRSCKDIVEMIIDQL